MSRVVMGPPSRNPLCRRTSGTVRSVSQIWARSQLCTAADRPEHDSFAQAEERSKIKIANEKRSENQADRRAADAAMFRRILHERQGQMQPREANTPDKNYPRRPRRRRWSPGRQKKPGNVRAVKNSHAASCLDQWKSRSAGRRGLAFRQRPACGFSSGSWRQNTLPAFAGKNF